MAKLMELVIQGQTTTGMFINKYNLFNTSLGAGATAALNVIEACGYDSGAPTTPVANSIFARYLGLTFPLFEFTQFYCRDVYDVNDFAQVNVSGVGWQGSRPTSTMEYPAFVGKIKSTRTRQDIKAGFKALPPMGEVDLISPTGVLAASYITAVSTFVATLADGVSPFVGLGQYFFGWTIVGKEEYTTPSGKKAYRYYEDPATQYEHLAQPVTWTPIERVTTQNTRKFGRGR